MWQFWHSSSFITSIIVFTIVYVSCLYLLGKPSEWQDGRQLRARFSKLMSLLVVSGLLAQPYATIAWAITQQPEALPTYSNRLPEWYDLPQFRQPQTFRMQEAAPQLRNASPLAQINHVQAQLPEELSEIIADSLMPAILPAYDPTMADYPLPPSDPTHLIRSADAMSYAINLPVIANNAAFTSTGTTQPNSAAWGDKPLLGVVTGDATQIATQLNLNRVQKSAVSAAMATEQKAIDALNVEANVIISDKTLSLEEKQKAIADMNYNNRLQTILSDTAKQLEAELGKSTLTELITFAEARFEQMRIHTTQMRANTSRLASATNQCYETTVWGTTSTYTDYSVDLPDKELKFANRGIPNTVTGYENPPYTVSISTTDTITDGIIVTDIIENTNDNYWRTPTDALQPRRWGTDLPLGQPQAEAAFIYGHNGGNDQYGRRVTSPAGISLSQPLAAMFGVSYPYTITVSYDWDCDGPDRLNRTFGLNNFTSYTSQGVNPATGNQFQWFRDFIIPGRGLNVDMVRYYNAQLNEDGMFGLGWSSIYDMYLRQYGSGVIEIRYADGHKGYFTPNGDGTFTAEAGVNEVVVTTADGYRLTTKDQIFFDFNNSGVLQTISDPNGNSQTLGYNGNDLTTITDSTGRVYTLTYDGFGHVTQINTPDGRNYKYTYGTTSLRATRSVNNGGNQLLQMTDARGGNFQHEYDPSGNWMTSITDQNGISYLNNVYTPDGRVQQQMDAKGNASTMDYDLENLRATETDALGNKTIFYFDEKYRVIQEEDALGNSTYYTYDNNDNMTSMTDKRGNTWTYTYDDRGNMLTKTDPVDTFSTLYYKTDVTTYTYDGNNNMLTMTDPLNFTTTYEYDSNNNMVKVIESNGATTEAVYNDDGQIETLTDALMRETRYEYDSNGNLEKTINPDGKEVTSTYDDSGNELSRTDELGRVTRYEYDESDNMTKMIDPLLQETLFEYDDNNWMVKKTDRRDAVWKWEYDDNGNPTLERDAEGNVVKHTYDKMNNRLTTKDARNNTTTFEYNKLYRLIKVTDAKDNITRYEYDENGNLLVMIDAHDERTRFTYDSANRRKYVYDALGGVTEYCYDPLDRIIRMFDPRRAKTDFIYDEVGNMVEVHDPLANKITFEYDLVHNRTAVTDANGQITTFLYDTLNREIATTNALSETFQTGYDAVGNTTIITDALGYTTTYQYNDNNWMISTINALGEDARFGYDDEGNRISFTDENDNTTQYEYNLTGYLLTTTDPLTGTTHLDYDENYNVITQTNALNQETVFTYDQLNLLTNERDALGNETNYKYDALQRLTKVTDAENNKTRYAYDALGRLTSVTDALDQTTKYTYDSVGNLVTIKDANGIETEFTYNFLNQLKTEVNPLGDKWTYGYDGVGNMVLRVDGEWQATGYRYDAANRLTRVIYGSTGQQVDYTYDKNGNELSMTDWNGTFEYSYDRLNRRVSAEDYNGRTLNYDYDAAGNRTEMVYPDGQAITMSYDANNRLDTLTDPKNRDVTWDYNALGYIEQQTNPNGTSTSYTYDVGNRLAQLSNDGPSGVIARYDYTMDDVGNRVQVVEERSSWVNPVTRDYTYDDLYRLTRVETSTGADTEYTFDAVGNRQTKSGIPEPAVGISVTAPISVNYGYNDLNSMLTAGDTDFEYDLNGSRVGKSEPISATEYFSVAVGMGIYSATVETDYVYSYENRVTQVSTYISATDGTTLTLPIMEAVYTYDGYGRRVNKLVTTTITSTAVLTTPEVLNRYYVFDGLDPVAEYEETTGAITETVVAHYYRANGRIVMQERAVDEGATKAYWYHADGLTTVVAFSGETGIFEYENQYDEYGNLLDSKTDSANRYNYTGQEIDKETGHYHFFARQYDPEVGTWTTQDSYRGTYIIPSTFYRYQYVENNALNQKDLYGYLFDSLREKISDLGNKIVYTASKVRTKVQEKVADAKNYVVDKASSASRTFLQETLPSAGTTIRNSRAHDYIDSAKNRLRNFFDDKINQSLPSIPFTNALEASFLAILGEDKVKLEGDAINQIRQDEAVISMESAFIEDLKNDPRYGSEAFGVEKRTPIQLGGQRAPGSMSDQLFGFWREEYQDTWRVAGNELTWLLRSVHIDSKAQIDKSGNIIITHQLNDILDLRPDWENRIMEYNLTTAAMGFGYHDLLGATELQIEASWESRHEK